jgi:hypothetical protein
VFIVVGKIFILKSLFTYTTKLGYTRVNVGLFMRFAFQRLLNQPDASVKQVFPKVFI